MPLAFCITHAKKIVDRGKISTTNFPLAVSSVHYNPSLFRDSAGIEFLHPFP